MAPVSLARRFPTRSEFARGFLLNTCKHSAQISIDFGRTLVRTGRHLAELQTALSILAVGLFSLWACCGNPDNMPRWRSPGGDPSAGELSQSRVEGVAVARRLPQNFQATGTPKVGAGLRGDTKFSLTQRLFPSCKRQCFRRGGRWTNGAGLGVSQMEGPRDRTLEMGG